MKISNRTVTAITIISVLFICGVNIFLFNKNYLEPMLQNSSSTNASGTGTGIGIQTDNNNKNKNKNNKSNSLYQKQDNDDSIDNVDETNTSLRRNRSRSRSDSKSKSSSSSSTRKKKKESEISTSTSKTKKSLAMDIVHKTYDQTFASLVELCSNDKEESLKDCFSKLYLTMNYRHEHEDNQDTNNEENEDTASKLKSLQTKYKYSTQHWWFRSMIRNGGNFDDVPRGELHGPWHIGQAKDPNVSMCMIEKVGIKHWQDLFAELNHNEDGERVYRPGRPIPLPDDAVSKSSSEYYPSFVFLRDPLDRFLSAYIDKCVHPKHRKKEEHCEPNEIFNTGDDVFNPMLAGFSFSDDVDIDSTATTIGTTEDESNGDNNDKKKKKQTTTIESRSNKKAMFAAYVDTMPLTWNLHFFPQSLYCNGIFRFIDQYDYVGYMNGDFHRHLNAIGTRYGGRFESALKDVFEYDDEIQTRRRTMTTNDAEAVAAVGIEKQTDSNDAAIATATAHHTGVETKASDKVKEYYTPRSLRQVLQYVSIDYMLLNMNIPQWAEEMLQEEEKEFEQGKE